MIKDILNKVVGNEDLTFAEMENVMNYILSGEATSAQIAGFLVALRCKGETATEIAAGASVLRKHSTAILNHSDSVDTCGTGGDNSNTFNISTTVAIVLASCGVKVVKHGNSAVSSKSGSADVLKALGVEIELNSTQVEKCISKENIGFMFAPMFHPVMKYVAPVRRELGLRTIFNLLGPLANPASCDYQVLGVYDKDLTEKMAYALKELGVVRAMVVHGLDGLDEISTTAQTKVSELKDGKISTYYISPSTFGVEVAKGSDLVGGDSALNASIITDILAGKQGPKMDIVLVNVAAALYVSGFASDLKEGFAIAKEAVLSGSAFNKLESFKNISRGVKNDIV